MKKISTIKFLKFVACILVVTQGIFLSLLATFLLSNRYVDVIMQYPQNSYQLNLNAISEQKTVDVLNYLEEASQKYNLMIVRSDIALNKDGAVKGLELGILGQTSNELNLSYLNQEVLNQVDINDLLTSVDKEATIGYNDSSDKVIKSLPNFKFNQTIALKKLKTIIQHHHTVNGFYNIYGLSANENEIFLTELSQITGIDKQSFDNKLSGRYIDDSFKEAIYLFLFVAHTIILLAVIFVMTIQSIQNLGIRLLLGWSKWRFMKELYRPLGYTGLMAMIISVLSGYYFANMTFNSGLFFSIYLLVGVINLVMTLVLCAMPSVLILSIKPINAIRNRLSKKSLMILTSILYVLANSGLMFACYYVDGPLKYIENNAKTAMSWQSVSQYYVIKQAVPGDDNSSFTGQSNKYNTDIYHWYKAIADKEGVYLVHSEYYSKERLNNLSGNKTYRNIPQQPFWKLSMSPNYLAQLTLDLDGNIIKQAQQGVRVYLIPDSFSSKEQAAIRDMFMESSTRSLKESDIQTVFTKEKQFAFIPYHINKEVFTWTTEVTLANYTTVPVIYITTPENMRFSESESLSTPGLDNAYIKLTQAAKTQYTTPQYMSQYHLDDNKITFVPIQNYIDGLQKQLWQTVEWFATVILAMTIIVIAMLYTIAILYRLIYQEMIMVKQFLGFSLFKIYRLLMVGLFLISIIDVSSMFVMQSKIGIICMSCVSLLQFFILYRVLSANKIKHILTFIK